MYLRFLYLFRTLFPLKIFVYINAINKQPDRVIDTDKIRFEFCKIVNSLINALTINPQKIFNTTTIAEELPL